LTLVLGRYFCVLHPSPLTSALCAACCRVMLVLLVVESNLNCIDKTVIKLMFAETRCKHLLLALSASS
jgi:hypothetical protein